MKVKRLAVALSNLDYEEFKSVYGPSNAEPSAREEYFMAKWRSFQKNPLHWVCTLDTTNSARLDELIAEKPE